MRIITGTLKGRRLEALPGDRVRPTSDKVKEAIFSMVEGYYQNGVAVDLFCGTGNLGLEALSRGAERVYFADRAKESLDLTRRNIEHCGVKEQCVCLQGEWQRTLARIPRGVDLFLLDPPYKAGILEDCIREIDAKELLTEDGLVVAEHGADVKLPESIGGLEAVKTRTYGKIAVTIYARAEEQDGAAETDGGENETE